MSLPVAEENEGPLLLCPECGFDLRGTGSERCGECGLEIDREALSVSGIPWAHRRRLGRVRAYVTTAWQIAIDRKALRYEAGKPQDVADGRAFRRVTGALLGLDLAAAFLAIVHFAGGMSAIALQVRMPDFTTIATSDPRWMDVAIPWFAGMTLRGVMPACLVLLGFWLAGAQRFVFRVGGAPMVHRLRAVALSSYTTAPLLLLVPTTACWVTLAALEKSNPMPDARRFPHVMFTCVIAGSLLFLLAWLGTVYRTAQWLARTRHGGLGGAVLGVAELVGLWLLGVVVTVGLLPWCAGFFRIAIDSLR